jgi:hypothetical protein
MGRYRDTLAKKETKVEGPHPIWRGIGCLIIIIVPVLSFAAANLTMPFFRSRGLIPPELLGTPQLPDWLWYVPVLAGIVHSLIVRPAFLATMVLTFLYILILGGIFSVVYALMYRMVAPPKYGPMDAPPSRAKTKKYKR